MNVAVQVDAGRFLPEKVKLKAPVYYSYTKEKTTPKYNPLDDDVLLKDALDATSTKQQRDSISDFAITNHTVKSFSVSGLKFDVKSKNPMPWDPANFTFSYSFNKQHTSDPDNVYENTNDYRGSFSYSWTPYAKPFTPFKRMINAKNKNMKFLREWELHWLPTSISFNSNISRYYYEQQTRNTTDASIEIPVSVSKNFLWDRQFAISWAFTKSFTVSLNTQTTAHILEPVGQVNKKLFPDAYRDWKDSVWRSIKNLGTPWAYNQTFSASYKAPFSSIPILSFITANATYNATYNWDRGSTLDGVFEGNTVANQAVLNVDGRFNMETLYNKIPYLKDVNKRFSGSGGSVRNQQSGKRNAAKKPKKFDRTYKLQPDSTFIIKHNMNVKKIRVTAITTDGKRYPIKYKVKDNNNIEVLSKGDENVKITITEIPASEKKGFLYDFAQYSTRFLMSVRSVSVKFSNTRQLSLPQFVPNVGDIFGQNNHYDVMAPGLDFAFGFTDDSYIQKAQKRGWLLNNQDMTTPAIYSKTNTFNAEVQLEPIRGLKITVTGNRTDNRTNQYYFMYDSPTVMYSGSYTKTHMAIATALRGVSSNDGYHSDAFDKFIENIPIVQSRIESRYAGKRYPNSGFIAGTVYADQPYDKANGTISQTSSDVLIPAFVAAYSGKDAKKYTLNPFPGLKDVLPNWRVTYDGLTKIPFFKRYFKSFSLTHAYQCTYSVGSYSSYSDWVSIGEGMGFTKNELTGNPVPSSPYDISTVTITEKFAPLLGFTATMQNNVTFNAEYRDSRTLSLNTSAGQVVEANSKSLVIGGGYKIANFNSVLKIRKRQTGISNDLTLKLDFQLANNTALIRKIEGLTAQATSGTRTLGINFTANYVMSKRITLGAYFDYQVNTPLVSTTAYPTTNANYGISLNMSLAR